MMPDWLLVLGAVLTALVLVASLVLVVRGAWDQGKIAELRADNDDLRARDQDRVKEISELRISEATLAATSAASTAALELRVSDLERDKQTLIEAATQAPAIKELTAKVDAALARLERST